MRHPGLQRHRAHHPAQQQQWGGSASTLYKKRVDRRWAGGGRCVEQVRVRDKQQKTMNLSWHAEKDRGGGGGRSTGASHAPRRGDRARLAAFRKMPVDVQREQGAGLTAQQEGKRRCAGHCLVAGGLRGGTRAQDGSGGEGSRGWVSMWLGGRKGGWVADGRWQVHD